MKDAKNFQDFLTTQVPQMTLLDFASCLALAVLLGYLLKKVFESFSHVQGNKALIGNNLVFICVTTTVIISVVKSSLALSLGLVGALSIVRFRTAVKDPEELAFLFMSIALGLGLGADQKVITIIGFSFLIGVVALLSRRSVKEKNGQSFNLLIYQKEKPLVPFETVKNSLEKKSKNYELKRWELSENQQEIALQLILQKDQSGKLLAELLQEFPSLRFRLFEPIDIS